MTMAAVKRVCVVGAGPSGLVAAKTLTHSHPGRFNVTVYEQSSRIGGLWPLSKQDDGMVNPEMCTNQSRHSVSFSDLAWEQDARIFPQAWEVGRYLERYRGFFGVRVELGLRVDKATFEDDVWTVTLRGKEGVDSVLQFEHLIVASGFFGKPRIPKGLDGEVLMKGGNVSHSSQFRDIEGLKLHPEGRNIIVVGGQMSGVEVAASIAHQLSFQSVSPGGNKEISNKSTVTHIIQKPFWVMPLLFPLNPRNGEDFNPAPEFLPLDLVSYNIQVRPPGSLINTSGIITETKAGPTHDYMEEYIGTDQSDLGVPSLSMKSSSSVRSQPPWLAISDNYIEFVRSRGIRVIQGRVTGDTNENIIKVEVDGKETTIGEVAAVILATGFEPSPSLSFLPQETLKVLLDFDPTADAFPLALNVHATTSCKIPSLGFVGFYRSPYWAVMEMQARYLGKLWSGDSEAAKALQEDNTMDEMMKLRHEKLCAQFPMGDYAYLMESFSRILGIERYEPGDKTERSGIVFPARYSYRSTAETELSIRAVYSTLSAGNGQFVARAVFRGIQGDWKLNRTITSFNVKYPSGSLSGTAKFMPRDPTDEDYDLEYFYLEEGQFNTTSGLTLGAKRSYVFRYSEAKDNITAWFTKEDRSVDCFFHGLEFSKGQNGWVAKASHWCKPDQYEVDYEFSFRGATLMRWSWRYKVKGPAKDYEAFSQFTR